MVAKINVCTVKNIVTPNIALMVAVTCKNHKAIFLYNFTAACIQINLIDQMHYVIKHQIYFKRIKQYRYALTQSAVKTISITACMNSLRVSFHQEYATCTGKVWML